MFVALAVVNLTSTLVGVQGNEILFRTALDHFRQGRLRMKFLALQGVVLLENIQSVVLRILAQTGLFSCGTALDSHHQAMSMSVVVAPIRTSQWWWFWVTIMSSIPMQRSLFRDKVFWSTLNMVTSDHLICLNAF